MPSLPTVWPRNPPIRFRKNVPTVWIGLELIEGKNRQVRRMCEAIGRPVLKLVRIRIGSYALGSIPVGDFVLLSPSDLKKLLTP